MSAPHGGAKSRAAGVTLLELMVVIVVIGLIAAVAMPAYVGYMRQSKTAEVHMNLKELFQLAASYYQVNRSVGHATGACSVDTTSTGWEPVDHAVRRDWESDENFRALKFTVADATYYVYEIDSTGSTCGNYPSMPTLYTMRGRGDLDGDAEQSTFELSVATDANNQLMRNSGVFVLNEYE